MIQGLSKDNFLQSIIDNATKAVIPLFSDGEIDIQEIENDIKDFINAQETSLEKWTIALAEEKISKTEYEQLVGGLRDVIQLKLLYAKGLSREKIAEAQKTILVSLIKFVFGLLRI